MSEQRTDTQEGAQPAAGAAIGAAARSGQPTHPTAAALAEWRRLAEQATPGPWETDDQIVTTPCGGAFVADTSIGTCPTDREWANAAYIAHSSPDRILALLSAYEAERARGERLEKERERLDSGLTYMSQEWEKQEELTHQAEQRIAALTELLRETRSFSGTAADKAALFARIDDALAPEGGAE